MAFQSIQQGWNQATAAMQSTMARGVGARTSGTTRRKRRAKAAKPARRVARARASSKRPARLVKGSAAAKRYMASIRKRK